MRTWKTSFRLWLRSGGGVIAAPALAQQPKVLRVTMHADVRTLDPFWTTQTIAGIHGLMVFDTLFSSDAELKPQPQMVDTGPSATIARSTPSLSATGLPSDGSKVTSKDVVASMNRWGKRDAPAALFNYTASPSRRTIRRSCGR